MAHLQCFYHYSGEFRVAVGMTTMIWNMMGLNALKFATKETFEKKTSARSVVWTIFDNYTSYYVINSFEMRVAY
jgi:hypothetical protein